MTTGRRAARAVEAAFTGLVALSAYAGVWGLATGAIDFGAEIEARVPWMQPWLTAPALLLVVAAPMTVASLACWQSWPVADDVLVAAGLAQIAWIAVQLAVIQEYSFFHPAYLAVGLAVAVAGWLPRGWVSLTALAAAAGRAGGRGAAVRGRPAP